LFVALLEERAGNHGGSAAEGKMTE
jgi:hypothetical protein